MENLVSFHVVERKNNKNFLTWTYPTLTDTDRTFLLEKCFQIRGYFCKKYKKHWFYFSEIEEDSTLILLAKEFEPNKYKALCDILIEKYNKNKNPVDLVRLYLNLFTPGNLTGSLKNFESVTNLKEFIRAFDLEIILIYTALLLKRRILVYNSNNLVLLNNLFTISHLIPSRNVQEFLFPFVESLNLLKGVSFFVAGTGDAALPKNETLYDLFVNGETCEITISSKAEGIMTMTKTHKEIATFLVKLSSSESSEKEVKDQIMGKTNELIELLKNIASIPTNNKKMLTLSDLKAKNFHPNLENFLFNLAIAENMMIL